MASKYHRQGFVGAGIVKKLLTSKNDKQQTLMKLAREVKKLANPNVFKDKTINIKGIGKRTKEIITPEEYIDISNMSNNQLKKQIQALAYTVGNKAKKSAKKIFPNRFLKEIKTEPKKKK